MKNIFSNLAAFCLGLSVCVAIMACANDTDDYSSNSIEVLSEQIVKLTERVKELEKSSKNTMLPKVVITEIYNEDTAYDGFISKGIDDYTFDEEGRITKITNHYSEKNSSENYSETCVYNVTYSDNKCKIWHSTGLDTDMVTLTFDGDDIKNVRAVNNMIVSIFTEEL